MTWADNHAEGLSWSDWGEFGGRYKDIIPPEGIMRYVDAPEKAEELLITYQTYSDEQVKEYLNKVGSLTLREVYQTVTNMVRSDNVEKWTSEESETYHNALSYSYNSSALLDFAWRDRHTVDTPMFDVTAVSSDLRYFRERLANDPERQYLLMYDFHY